MQNAIKLNYPNVIFTKLNICSTFEKEEEFSANPENKQNVKEENSQDIITPETQLSSKSAETDVDMISLEDSNSDLGNGYFCRYVKCNINHKHTCNIT